MAKKYNKEIKIVMGGPHVTFVPEKTFKECPYIEFIVRGVSELTFKELIESLRFLGSFTKPELRVRIVSIQYRHLCLNLFQPVEAKCSLPEVSIQGSSRSIIAF